MQTRPHQRLDHTYSLRPPACWRSCRACRARDVKALQALPRRRRRLGTHCSRRGAAWRARPWAGGGESAASAAPGALQSGAHHLPQPAPPRCSPPGEGGARQPAPACASPDATARQGERELHPVRPVPCSALRGAAAPSRERAPRCTQARSPECTRAMSVRTQSSRLGRGVRARSRQLAESTALCRGSLLCEGTPSSSCS